MHQRQPRREAYMRKLDSY